MGAIVGLAILGGCGLVTQQPILRTVPAAKLTPAEAHAGNVLAYFLQVVCGQVGNGPMQAQWRTRGVNVPLDFLAVQRVMASSTSQKNDIMVLDPAVLGLARVLYHYNPRFNQLKGESLFTSVYPSAELVALRLFLVRHMDMGTPIRLSALKTHESLLGRPGALPSEAALATMGLTPDAFRYLQAIFASAPQLMLYYTHPAIVAALVRMGVYASDDRAAALGAPTVTAHSSPNHWGGKVRVAVVPSLTTEFDAINGAAEVGASRLTPSETLTRQLNKVVVSLRSVTESRVARDLSGPASAVSIHRMDQRPRVIHPGNAGTVIPGHLPWADVVVVVLGRDVYRVMTLPDGAMAVAGRDVVFLDLDDIRQGQMDDAVSAAADAIARRLAASAS